MLGAVSRLGHGPEAVPMEAVRNFVESLLESYSVQTAAVASHTDPWSCVFCSSVLEDPVSLVCGHSCCKKCMMRDITGVCRKCKTKFTPVEEDPIDIEPYIKVTVLVSSLVTKYWHKDLEAIKLRGEGNRLYQRGSVKESIEKYGEAIRLSPDDHLNYGNRSNAFYKNGSFEEALEDANKSVELKPDWGKSYFRKGMALAALHRYEEAVVVYFQCFLLEDKCSKTLKTEIVKAMYKLITAKGAESENEVPSTLPTSLVQLVSQGGSNTASDGESDTQESDSSKSLIAKNKRLVSVLDRIEEGVKQIVNPVESIPQRPIDPEAVDKDDFDCALCFRLLWQPVTTPCGHTYCRACLDRSLDHKPECPLCKSSIPGFQKSNNGVTEFVEATIKRMLPGEYCQRQKQNEDEMNELLESGNDGSQIPVFVCTMSFPCVPCPLHVFEPRYRLMIRRAMESGTRQFGMCVGSQEHGFSDYGTMLEIRDIQYFEDGRSVVDTIGGKRFKVLSRGVKDGYNTAKVEYLHDEVLEGEDLENLKSMHEKIRTVAETWFSRMEPDIKSGILSHYGDMPGLEHEYWRLASGPAWCWWVLAIMPLDNQAQQQILSQNQLTKRLEAIARILGFMKRRGCF